MLIIKTKKLLPENRLVGKSICRQKGFIIEIGVIIGILAVVYFVYFLPAYHDYLKREQSRSISAKPVESPKLVEPPKPVEIPKPVTWNDFNQKFSQLENDVKQTFSLLKEKASQN